MRKLFGATLALAFIAAPAAAQQSVTQGLMLNVHLNGSAISLEDSDESENGGGIGFGVGYGFTPSLLVFAAGDGASMNSADEGADNYTLGHFDVGARYSFANSARAWTPYVEAAFSGISAQFTEEDDLGNDVDVTMGGTGFSFGGGVQYAFSQPLSLDVGLRFTTGNFKNLEVDGEEFELDEDLGATATRFNIGLSWYPMKRFQK